MIIRPPLISNGSLDLRDGVDIRLLGIGEEEADLLIGRRVDGPDAEQRLLSRDDSDVGIDGRRLGAVVGVDLELVDGGLRIGVVDERVVVGRGDGGDGTARSGGHDVRLVEATEVDAFLAVAGGLEELEGLAEAAVGGGVEETHGGGVDGGGELGGGERVADLGAAGPFVGGLYPDELLDVGSCGVVVGVVVDAGARAGGELGGVDCG